ncbi:MAG: hypothetical protein WAV76_02075 [Bacteroidota bacterium]
MTVSADTSTVVLNGEVNTENISTTVRFLYGTVSGVYTDSVDASQSPVNSTDTSVSVTPNNLSAGTVYYFCIAAQNANGDMRGSEQSFMVFSTFPGESTSYGRLHLTIAIYKFQPLQDW